MTEQDKKIIATFVRILPNLTESDKQRLLWFGEGMAFKAESMKESVLMKFPILWKKVEEENKK